VLTIGLVGGMSWESSAAYYKLLNQGVEDRLGGLNSARLVLSSVEFGELTALQRQERWDDVAEVLAGAARGVESAGADLLLLCTTSFHRVADQVEEAVGIPLLHLGDVVAEAVKAADLETVGFLGTSFAMSRSFFTDRIASHGLKVVTPAEERHDTVNRIIYEELVHGRVLDSSRRTLVRLIEELWDQGAEGVILGCTELELLVKQADSEMLLFPCTTLHVKAALDRALAQ
jgi:aspartate racemase